MKAFRYLWLALLICSVNAVELKKTFVVAVPPIKQLVEELAGNEVVVVSMLEGGENPVSWQPTPKELVLYEKAEGYFFLGMPFEVQMKSRFSEIWSVDQIVNLQEGQVLLVGHSDHDGRDHGGRDHHEEAKGMNPHTWTSPLRALKMVDLIKERLGSIVDSTLLESRYTTLKHRLLSMQARIETDLSKYKGKSVLFYHPSFTYLLKEAGLKELSVEVDGKIPTGRSLASLIRKVKKNKCKTLWVQPEFGKSKIKNLANELNVEIKIVKPLALDYLSELERFIDELFQELKAN